MGARSKTSSSGNKTDSWDHSSDSDGKSSISSSSHSSSNNSIEDAADLEAPVADFARAINESVVDSIIDENGAIQQIRQAKLLESKLRLEHKRKEHMMLKRYLYEDVVTHSAPFPLVKFYIRNFKKILILLILFYVGCLTLAVQTNMFELNVIDPEDFFLLSKNTTKEYQVYKQLID